VFGRGNLNCPAGWFLRVFWDRSDGPAGWSGRSSDKMVSSGRSGSVGFRFSFVLKRSALEGGLLVTEY
jgi:hypothetical protein